MSIAAKLTTGFRSLSKGDGHRYVNAATSSKAPIPKNRIHTSDPAPLVVADYYRLHQEPPTTVTDSVAVPPSPFCDEDLNVSDDDDGELSARSSGPFSPKILLPPNQAPAARVPKLQLKNRRPVIKAGHIESNSTKIAGKPAMILATSQAFGSQQIALRAPTVSSSIAVPLATTNAAMNHLTPAATQKIPDVTPFVKPSTSHSSGTTAPLLPPQAAGQPSLPVQLPITFTAQAAPECIPAGVPTTHLAATESLPVAMSIAPSPAAMVTSLVASARTPEANSVSAPGAGRFSPTVCQAHSRVRPPSSLLRAPEGASLQGTHIRSSYEPVLCAPESTSGNSLAPLSDGLCSYPSKASPRNSERTGVSAPSDYDLARRAVTQEKVITIPPRRHSCFNGQRRLRSCGSLDIAKFQAEASVLVDYLLACLEHGDMTALREGLESLRGSVTTAAARTDAAVSAYTAAQDESSRLEGLALEQWRKIGTSEQEIRRLRDEIVELRIDRDRLVGENYHLQQQRPREIQPKLAAQLESTLAEKFEAEQAKRKAEKDVVVLERCLIEAKLKLAQQKDATELALKLCQYYTRHLEECNPAYIIPLLDRKRVEQLQLAEIMPRHHRGATGPPPKRHPSLTGSSGTAASHSAGGSSAGVGGLHKLFKTLVGTGVGSTAKSGSPPRGCPSPDHASGAESDGRRGSTRIQAAVFEQGSRTFSSGTNTGHQPRLRKRSSPFVPAQGAKLAQFTVQAARKDSDEDFNQVAVGGAPIIWADQTQQMLSTLSSGTDASGLGSRRGKQPGSQLQPPSR